MPTKALLAGFNDLQTYHPDLAKQWHPSKNADLKPTEVLPGSGKKRFGGFAKNTDTNGMQELAAE